MKLIVATEERIVSVSFTSHVVASRKRTFPLLVAQPANVCSDRIARLYITQTGGPRLRRGGNINLSTNRDHARLPELLLKLIYSQVSFHLE